VTARAGPDVPPLIALPGTLLDGRSLQALLALVAREDQTQQVVILGECAGLDDELARLAALAAEPAVWLGHSLGGIVALQLARRHPQCVAGLLLLAANARTGPPNGPLRWQAQWREAQAHGLAALARAKLAPGYGVGSNAALVQSLADQAETVGLQRFAHQLHYAGQRPGLLSPRQALPWPVLALSGGHDALCPPTQSEEIASLSPRGRHLSLAGGGHLFPLQAAPWAARQLRHFLDTFSETPPCA